MYCPKCFNDSLRICSKGVINIVINGKQMDAGRILFNLENEEKLRQFKPSLKTKIKEFFNWYSNFQNKDPVTVISIDTSDMQCEEGCVIAAKNRFSIIDVLITKSELIELLQNEGQRHNIEIKLAEE